MRSFISQGVDAIVIAPIVSDGWDDVLNEAKTAKIPVVLEDRTTSSPDDLFASWVGDDFKKEGETAGTWAAEQYGSTPTKMVVLEGTTGSAPANDRAAGFSDAIKGTQIKTIASQTGDFTRDGGKKVMEGFLQKYGVKGINLVFAHNDDMALGAIEAIEAAGGKPGTDIHIVSIDGVHDGMQALVDGKINYIVECNPLLGDQAADLVKKVLAGTAVEKKNFAHDGAFTQAEAKAVIDSPRRTDPHAQPVLNDCAGAELERLRRSRHHREDRLKTCQRSPKPHRSSRCAASPFASRASWPSTTSTSSCGPARCTR